MERRVPIPTAARFGMRNARFPASTLRATNCFPSSRRRRRSRCGVSSRAFRTPSPPISGARFSSSRRSRSRPSSRAASGARGTFAFLAACALAIAFGPVTSDLALGQVALLAFLAAVLASLPMRAARRVPWRALRRSRNPTSPFGLVALLGRNRATDRDRIRRACSVRDRRIVFRSALARRVCGATGSARARRALRRDSADAGRNCLRPGRSGRGLRSQSPSLSASPRVLAVVALWRHIRRSVRAIRRRCRARAVRHDVLSRARSGRRVRRGRLVRVSHARCGARPRARGDAPRGDRLAGARAAPTASRRARCSRRPRRARSSRSAQPANCVRAPFRGIGATVCVVFARWCVARRDSPGTRLARRTRRVPRRRECFGRRRLGRRTAAHRIARDRTGVGAPANVTVARLRSAQLLRFRDERAAFHADTRGPLDEERRHGCRERRAREQLFRTDAKKRASRAYGVKRGALVAKTLRARRQTA